MNGIKVFLELTRPLNSLILALSVLLAIALTHKLTFSMPVVLAVLSAVLIASGGNVLNDCFDITSDRLNKPWRPLPSDKVRIRDAYIFAWMLLTAGCGLAVLISPANLIMALLAAMSLIVYDYRYKNRPLTGNLIVSFLTACAFLYGGFAVNDATETIIPAIFSFFFHLGREIIKDVEDLPGDIAQGSETLPILWGKTNTLAAATIIYGLVIILTLVPYWAGIYSWRYLIVAVFGVDFVLVYLLVSLWRDSSIINLGRISRFLKYDMVVGILAIYLH